MKPSDRARALIEALHEPTSNEERWTIAENFLRMEFTDGVMHGRGYHCHRHKEKGWRVQCFEPCGDVLSVETFPWLGTEMDEREDGQPTGYRSAQPEEPKK